MDMDWLGRELALGISGGALASSLLVLLAVSVAAYALRRVHRRLVRLLTTGPGTAAALLEAVHLPLLLGLWLYGLAGALFPLLPAAPSRAWLVLAVVTHGLGLVLAVWLLARVTRRLMVRVDAWAAERPSPFDRYFLPFLARTLLALVPVLAMFVALPLLALPEALALALRDLASLLLIGAVAGVLIHLINLGERLLVERFQVNVSDNLQARRVHTQAAVLRKLLVFIVIVLALASMLMVFDKVRQLGASILASAGVLGLIVGFAAQKVLGNLLAGIQIALTQPIRIDDAVVVEGEWGWVEELTLTYVVIRIWDQRRLVLPITYFVEKPFQNWTRNSAELLGVVFLYADYQVPVEALRAELARIAEASPLWDRRVCTLQVTDLGERSVQLRALVSARNGGEAWDLRCEVREKLVAFIRERYPQALPRFRAVLQGDGNAFP